LGSSESFEKSSAPLLVPLPAYADAVYDDFCFKHDFIGTVSLGLAGSLNEKAKSSSSTSSSSAASFRYIVFTGFALEPFFLLWEQ